MYTRSRRFKAPSEPPVWAAGPGVWASQDPCFRAFCPHSTLVCVCQLEACRSRYVQQCHVMPESQPLPQSPFHAALPKAAHLHAWLRGCTLCFRQRLALQQTSRAEGDNPEESEGFRSLVGFDMPIKACSSVRPLAKLHPG